MAVKPVRAPLHFSPHCRLRGLSAKTSFLSFAYANKSKIWFNICLTWNNFSSIFDVCSHKNLVNQNFQKINFLKIFCLSIHELSLFSKITAINSRYLIVSAVLFVSVVTIKSIKRSTKEINCFYLDFSNCDMYLSNIQKYKLVTSDFQCIIF